MDRQTENYNNRNTEAETIEIYFPPSLPASKTKRKLLSLTLKENGLGNFKGAQKEYDEGRTAYRIGEALCIRLSLPPQLSSLPKYAATPRKPMKMGLR